MSIISAAVVAATALGGLNNANPSNVVEEPNFGVEVGNVEYEDFANTAKFYKVYKHVLSSLGKGTKRNPGKPISITEREGHSAYMKMMNYLTSEADFEPDYMSYNTIYPTDEDGERIAYGASDLEVPKYTEFKFGDNDGSRITFVFADDFDLEEANIEGEVVVYPSMRNYNVLGYVLDDIEACYGTINEPTLFAYEVTSDFTVNQWFNVSDPVLEVDLITKYYQTTFLDDGDTYNPTGGNFFGFFPSLEDYYFWLANRRCFAHTVIDLGAEISAFKTGVENGTITRNNWGDYSTVIDNLQGGYHTNVSNPIFYIGTFPIIDYLWYLHFIGIFEAGDPLFDAQVTALNRDIAIGQLSVYASTVETYAHSHFADVTFDKFDLVNTYADTVPGFGGVNNFNNNVSYVF